MEATQLQHEIDDNLISYQKKKNILELKIRISQQQRERLGISVLSFRSTTNKQFFFLKNSSLDFLQFKKVPLSETLMFHHN